MERYEIIESKAWRHKSGRLASIYGACPWYGPADKGDWELVTRGWTIRDNNTNTVGLGKPPFPTREAAERYKAEYLR